MLKYHVVVKLHFHRKIMFFDFLYITIDFELCINIKNLIYFYF
jgi:hypothetical protein